MIPDNNTPVSIKQDAIMGPVYSRPDNAGNIIVWQPPDQSKLIGGIYVQTLSLEAVHIIIEEAAKHAAIPLTQEEMTEYLTYKNRPLGEIETGGWEDMGISDNAAFVEELRRKESEQSSNWTPS